MLQPQRERLLVQITEREQAISSLEEEMNHVEDTVSFRYRAYRKDPHKRTHDFRLMLILFLYIRSFLAHQPEGVLKFVSGCYIMHRLLTDENNVQSQCFMNI